MAAFTPVELVKGTDERYYIKEKCEFCDGKGRHSFTHSCSRCNGSGVRYINLADVVKAQAGYDYAYAEAMGDFYERGVYRG